MKELEYARPQTVQEAVSLLKENGSDARMLAGGTDMLVLLRGGRREAKYLVDVKVIPELNELSYDPQKGLSLGAAVPAYRIYEDERISELYPALTDSASLIGGIQIQSRASIGGNLCNAAPSADAIPALIVHRAVCIIAGPNGNRELPVEDFCTGPGQAVLKSNELLVSLRMPTPPKNSGSMYLRFIPRNEMDIAVAGSGVSVVLSDDHKKIVSARVSLSAVAPTPLFVKEANDYLAGKGISDEVIAEAGEIAKRAAKPITDMRGTIEQRKHLCAVLTRRALKGAIDRAKEAK